ncbi:MAG: hypothetical protein QW569_00100 [Candidatus Bathyarchaeia archaeon]|nr:hypothetical protein [Candidatus Bathyarchaeota archaeon]
MKLRGSLMFLEGYFVGVICYVALTCLLFDPFNVVGFLLLGLSAASGLSIYLRRRIGFYLALLSSASAFITFIMAFRFSVKFRGGLTGTVYDASLALFSILSILAFVVVLDKYR